MPTARTALRRITDLPNRQTRLLLWIGFGGLLLLMGVLGLSAISFLYQIEIRQEKLRQDFVERDRTLERLRANIFLSGTYIRDFLLDTNEVLAARNTSFNSLRRAAWLKAELTTTGAFYEGKSKSPFNSSALNSPCTLKHSHPRSIGTPMNAGAADWA